MFSSMQSLVNDITDCEELPQYDSCAAAWIDTRMDVIDCLHGETANAMVDVAWRGYKIAKSEACDSSSWFVRDKQGNEVRIGDTVSTDINENAVVVALGNEWVTVSHGNTAFEVLPVENLCKRSPIPENDNLIKYRLDLYDGIDGYVKKYNIKGSGKELYKNVLRHQMERLDNMKD